MNRIAIALAALAVAIPAVAGCGGTTNAAGFSAGQFEKLATEFQGATNDAVKAVQACVPSGNASTAAESKCAGAQYLKMAAALDNLVKFSARYQATEPAGECADALKTVSRLGGALANDYSAVGRQFTAGDWKGAAVALKGKVAKDVKAWVSTTADLGTDLGGKCG